MSIRKKAIRQQRSDRIASKHAAYFHPKAVLRFAYIYLIVT